jgi:hypothetical protein
LANEVKISRETLVTAPTITNLNSLGNGNIWTSDTWSNTAPTFGFLEVFYTLTFNATPVGGDGLNFWWLRQDDDASEIFVGDATGSETELTTAASIASIRAIPQVHRHAWQTSHAVDFHGYLKIWDPGPAGQLAIQSEGEALSASGNVIHYRFATTEVQ